jgi:hypothetical protein
MRKYSRVRPPVNGEASLTARLLARLPNHKVTRYPAILGGYRGGRLTDLKRTNGRRITEHILFRPLNNWTLR